MSITFLDRTRRPQRRRVNSCECITIPPLAAHLLMLLIAQWQKTSEDIKCAHSGAPHQLKPNVYMYHTRTISRFQGYNSITLYNPIPPHLLTPTVP